MPTVKSAKLEYASGGPFACFSYGNARLVMEMSNGTTEYLEFYSDEIHISPNEVIGKTHDECIHIKSMKDKAYLQS